MKMLRTLLVFSASWLIALSAVAGVYDDMIVAARNDDAAKVVSLLERGMDVNTADANGTTLTMYAARAGNGKLLAYLLTHRAAARLKNRFGDSALSLAALEGRTECVQLLIDAGDEVDPPAGVWSPLSYAAFSGHLETVRLLMGKGADINAPAPNGMTPLMLAARNGHDLVVQALLESGANPGLKTPDGKSALDIAQAGNQEKIVEALRQRMATAPGAH